MKFIKQIHILFKVQTKSILYTCGQSQGRYGHSADSLYINQPISYVCTFLIQIAFDQCIIAYIILPSVCLLQI